MNNLLFGLSDGVMKDMYDPENNNDLIDWEDNPKVVMEHRDWEKGTYRDQPAPTPRFGLGGTFGGANPQHITAEPASPMLAFDQIRERFIRGGLDTFELVTEVKRLMRAGFIELNPRELKALVDAETKLAETVVKLADTEGKVPGLSQGDNKTLVLQVLNQTYNILADQMATARNTLDCKSSVIKELEATTVEVLPSTPEDEKLKKFRDSQKKV
jgi:hypothetical protein